MSRVSPTLALGFLLAAVPASRAQSPDYPTGMYCGGNQLVKMGALRASGVEGTVEDSEGSQLPWARVQVQIRGSKTILHDIRADDKGRFRVLLLQPGTYWLGISAQGWNLHIWELKIVRSRGVLKLRAVLSIGN